MLPTGVLVLVGLYFHYTLALCSEHTPAANMTIWMEALTGLPLMSSSAILLARRS